MKKSLLLLTIAVSALLFVGCGVSQSLYTDVLSENEGYQAEIKELKEDYDKLMSNYETIQKENEEYEAIIKPYKDLTAAELTAKTNEAKLKDEEARIALEELEKKTAEEAAAKEKAEKEEKEKEEKLGYDTGITFSQLARTPDDYIGKKVKFTGKVVQVLEGDDIVQLRLAIKSDYDKVIFIEYPSSIVKSRVLEDDIITIYGMSLGLYTYKSSLGTSITIPAVYVDKVDQ